MIMRQDIEENEKECVAVGGDVRINPICWRRDKDADVKLGWEVKGRQPPQWRSVQGAWTQVGVWQREVVEICGARKTYG